MRRPSLRWLMMLPILINITLGFGAFAAFADRLELASRLADVDAELERAERVGALRVSPLDEPPGPQGTTDADGPLHAVIDSSGNLVPGRGDLPFWPEARQRLTERAGSGPVTEGDYRVLVNSAPGDRLLVTALPLDSTNAATAQFRRALAGGGALVLTPIMVVLWVLTTLITRPVVDMAGRAGRIAAGEMDIVIGKSSGSKEITKLGEDLDSMLGTLRTALADSERLRSEANQSRDNTVRLLADMSHELRTPLTALKGYSELHGSGMLETDADVNRAMARIGSEADRLNRLANDMLQLARDEQVEAPSDNVDLGAVVIDAVNDLRAAFPDRTVALQLPDAAASTEVRGSAGHLHQAVLNIGANACEHCQPTDRIEVVVDTVDQLVTVAVVDHGEGIAEDERDQIFLPFYRVETSRHRSSGGGAGLGLALARQIAENHGGSLTVHTTAGGGATFVLSLPGTPATPGLRTTEATMGVTHEL